MMKKLIALAGIATLPFTSTAQQVRPATSAQIYHEINQLKHLTNVLYLAAHPDDENTRMLAWLVNDQHIPTAYLSLTRGDGGQNILGPQLGPTLGLIRTHELLEARKLDGGASQFFTRAIDFGFSKTSDETFKHWDEDQLTSDVVWIYRKFRPDVIICRFPPNEAAGHGQHAASAILAHKAFKASGDNNRYKDQFKHYTAWQPKRILFNAYRFGDRNTTTDNQFKLDVGQYNTLLGMGYGELAGISRSIHRSQGAGTRSVPGVQTEYLQLVDGDTFSKSIFDGIDITWGRVNRKDIGDKIEAIIKAYDFNHPEKSLPALLALYKDIKNVKDNDWKYQKLRDMEQLLLHTAGFMAEVVTEHPEATRGETLPFTFNVITRSGDVKVRLEDIACLDIDTVCHLFMPNDQLVTFKRTIQIPNNAPYTEPYWLSAPQVDDANFPIPDQKLLGLATTPNTLTAEMRVSIGDESILVQIPLSYKTLDATHGDVVEQLRVVPAVTLKFNSALYLAKEDNSFTVNVVLHANKNISNGTLLVYNPGISKEVSNINLRKGNDTTISVKFDGKFAAAVSYNDALLYAVLKDNDGTIYDKNQVTIKYEHLPTLQYMNAPYTKVLKKNWECAAKRIGYIEGAGDDVAKILSFTGLQVDILKAADVNAANLKKYDAILVGIRALNTVDEMTQWMPTLLEYTKEGGTLVMQYNTAQRLNTENFAPFPIKLSQKRVTEEDAAVDILAPEHKLMTYPNKITSADFEGWVQERGLYYADTWDEHYTPLFSMHDAGEASLKGGTLYTAYGKGHYIYTPLSFFRQLPAGNKGSVRLLCNFLSVGK